MKVLCRSMEEVNEFLAKNKPHEAKPVFWKVTEDGEFFVHEFYETEFEHLEGTSGRKMVLNEKPSMTLRGKKDDEFPRQKLSDILELTENRYTGHRYYRDEFPF